MRIPEGCKGCTLTRKRGGHYSGCSIRLYCSLKKVNSCPCQTCIIKVMCTTPCESYNNYKNILGLCLWVYGD